MSDVLVQSPAEKKPLIGKKRKKAYHRPIIG